LVRPSGCDFIGVTLFDQNLPDCVDGEIHRGRW
jgi:hypothetical protein